MKTLTASPPFFTALALVLVATPAHAQQDDTAVSVGVADSAKAGSLPPLTSELAKKAAKAISKQDWANARSAYTEMLESQPENPLTLANLGVVEFQAGELEKAKTHLEKAVYIQPSLASCWRTLGLIHYQQDELALALSTLARSLHEDGSNAEAQARTRRRTTTWLPSPKHWDGPAQQSSSSRKRST